MRRAALALIVVAALAAAAFAALVVVVETGDRRALIAGAVERATGRKLVIGGPLRLSILTLRPALVATEITLANAHWGSRPDMIRVRRLEAVLSLPALLGGELAVRELVLIEPDILLETDAAGNRNWTFAAAPAKTDGGAQAPAEAASAPAGLPVVGRLRVERGTLAYRDGVSGLERRVALTSATLDGIGGDGPVHVSAESEANGKPLRIQATLGSRAAPLAGTAPVPVTLDLTVGGTRIAARGEAALHATPAQVRLDVETPRADLADLLSAPGQEKTGRLFGDAPLPMAALAGLDATLALRVGELVGLTGIRLHELAGEVRIAQGVLAIGPVTGRAAGAPLEAAARLAPAGEAGELTASLRLAQADLGEIVREMSGKATLTGPVDLAIDMRGRGRTMAEVMAAAEGRLTIISGAGRLHSAFFDFLSADVVRAITPWAPRQAPTEIRCGVARFDFRGGVGRSRVIALDTSRATVIGEGVIDLRREVLDLLFEPTTKDLSALSVAALVPVRVHGRITGPAAEPAAGAAVTETATAVFDGALDAARWVGSRLGVTGRPSGAADPCPRARAVALGEATSGSAQPAAGSGGSGILPSAPDVVKGIKRLFD